MAAEDKHLLIGRKNGSSSSRLQRGFAGVDRTVAAIKRWEAEGFNGFWVYGPYEDGVRPLIGSWHREQPEARAAVITALGGTP